MIKKGVTLGKRLSVNNQEDPSQHKTLEAIYTPNKTNGLPRVLLPLQLQRAQAFSAALQQRQRIAQPEAGQGAPGERALVKGHRAAKAHQQQPGLVLDNDATTKPTTN